MSNLDPSVASLVDNKGDVSDDDALFEELEKDEPVLAGIRENRMQQLAAELSRAKHMKGQSYGSYTETATEKELMDITAHEAKYAVVHFFKPDFARCAVMDEHLSHLAAKHFDTRFLKMNVENAPFLVVKMKIQMLPCVVAFIDGVSCDRIIGFEGLGDPQSPNTFTARDLETRLLQSGVLIRQKTTENGSLKFSSKYSARTKKKVEEEEDDDDWD